MNEDIHVYLTLLCSHTYIDAFGLSHIPTFISKTLVVTVQTEAITTVSIHTSTSSTKMSSSTLRLPRVKLNKKYSFPTKSVDMVKPVMDKKSKHTSYTQVSNERLYLYSAFRIYVDQYDDYTSMESKGIFMYFVLVSQ